MNSAIHRFWWAVLLLAWMHGAEAATLYVWESSPSPGSPYDTLDTAAHDIQTAINAASAGDTVIVTNGSYQLVTGGPVAPIVVDKAITLQSANGAANTTIWRGSSATSTHVLHVAHVGAIVDGFTITNGNRRGVIVKAGLLRNSVVALNIHNNSGNANLVTTGQVENCVIRGNQARGGGGIGFDGTGVVRRCTIYGNYSSYGGNGDGGGVSISSSALVEGCIITNNNSGGGAGGGVSVGQGTLRNCFVANNFASSGGGLYVNNANSVVQNCTMVGNFVVSSSGSGGGVRQSNGSIRNCIIYNNRMILDNALWNNVNKSGGAFAFNCSEPLISSASDTNNIAANPHFEDISTNNCRLALGSPCIDAGQDITAVTNDLDLVTRAQDGDGTGGAKYDMGVFEAADFTTGSLRCGFMTPTNRAMDTLGAVFTASVAGANRTVSTYSWDFTTDSTYEETGSDKQIVTNAYASPGLYSVTLVVTNSLSETASCTWTNCIYVAPSTVYVAAASVSEVFPYDTWAKATTNVQWAINAAADLVTTSSLVLVSNGTYVSGTGFNILSNLTLKSVNGNLVTKLVRSSAGSTTQVVVMAALNPVVDGFTVSNGTRGGVYMYGGTVQNCIVCTNTTGSGVGVFMEAGLLLNSQIYSNQARNAAGIDVAGTGTVRGCSIAQNKASIGGGGSGGGLRMSAAGLVEQCWITNNYNPGNSAGGVYITAGTIRNCLIANNTASDGAGVRLNGSSAALQNCTVSDNVTSGNGGGIHLDDGSVRNCIIYYNTTSPVDNPSGNNVYKDGGAVAFSCSLPLLNTGSDTNNIDTDPAFEDRSAKNYRLASGSPCVDTGQDLSGVTNDLAGLMRPQDGDGASVTNLDMGAYEQPDSTNGPLRCGFSAPTTMGLDSLAAVFTATVAGSNQTGISYYWDFNNDGVYEREGTDKAVVTNVFSAGSYTITLVISNAAAEGSSKVISGYIYVAPSVIYVAPGALHTFPYDTWAKASTNLQEGINAGAATGTVGSTVWVSNGIYKFNSPMTVSNGITVRSVNGSDSVVITRDTSATALLNLNNGSAVVDGMSFTNGDSGPLGGAVVVNAGTLRNSQIINNPGVGLLMNGGILDSCLVSSNRSRYRGGIYVSGVSTVRWSTVTKNWGTYTDASGNGIGVCMTANALVENCLIVSNYSGTTGGNGGQGVYMNAGTLRNCLVASNYCSGEGPVGGGIRMEGGRVENCTIVGNALKTGYSSGAGVYASGGALTNCIIYNNYGYGGTNDNVRTNDIARFWYSCAPELTNSANLNITNNPVFVDFSAQNYRLNDETPCDDVGIVLPWMTGAKDADNQERVQGDGVEMGAYEMAPVGGSVLMFF